MKRFRALAIAALVATLALVAVGGLVRATGSGLGCPGWPKCWGAWWPPQHLDPAVFSAADVANYSYHHAVIEWAHRLTAALAIALVCAVAIAAVVWMRSNRRILWAAVGTAALIFVQAALGAIVVQQETAAWLVALHFGTAMLLVAALVYIVVATFDLSSAAGRADRGFVRLAKVTVVATFALMLVGAYVRATSATLAFSDWPLMNGRLVPTLGGAATAQFSHRLLAAAVGLLIAWTAVRAWTAPSRNPAVVALATAAGVLVIVQIAAGGAIVLSKSASWAIVTHEFTSSLVWASVVALALVARGVVSEPVAAQEDLPAPGEAATIRDVASAYVELMKPRIIVLLLITTVPAMILAEHRVPSLWLILATLVGGTLAAGSANAINCYIDRDIDRVMRRTRRRPVPAHKVTPDRALAFGFILGTIAFYFLAITVNVTAAGLAVSAIFFYVFVYTLWLKRKTEQNIVIGGAAGAAPALVGWAAVSGHLAVPALMLFAIVFVWTPPHFWALAMKYERDYAAASIPMMPVVRGREATVNQILAYSLVLVLVTLAMAPIAGMGQIYLASAVTLGGMFVYRALKLKRSQSQADAWRLFKFSIVYLALLFGAVALDGLVR